jgi:phage gpG-like protein
MKTALTTIGTILEARMRLNAEDQRLRRTGNLINSIRYQLFRGTGQRAGVMVGSWGVPYAAVHEFGFRGTVIVPAHSVSSHERRGRVVREHKRASYSRKVNIRRRPYIRPAVRELRDRIYEILRSTIKGD